jgi:hypothetical protein
LREGWVRAGVRADEDEGEASAVGGFGPWIAVVVGERGDGLAGGGEEFDGFAFVGEAGAEEEFAGDGECGVLVAEG